MVSEIDNASNLLNDDWRQEFPGKAVGGDQVLFNVRGRE
jgi:hypothetical protein